MLIGGKERESEDVSCVLLCFGAEEKQAKQIATKVRTFATKRKDLG